MARAPWYRGMTGCLQTLPRDEGDLDVEAGDLDVGELRPRPFLELARALTPEQRLAVATLALADIAVWPEIDPGLARALAAGLEGTSVPEPLRAPRAAPDRAALTLLEEIIPRLGRATDTGELASVWEVLRRAVHSVLRAHPRPFAATEQWLRRVVPLSSVLTAEEARHTAIRALGRRLGSGTPFVFATTEYDAREGLDVVMIARGRPAAPLGRVARFSRYVVTDRALHVTVEPLVELDPYRIQYFFRSLYLDDATNDAELGGYDRAVCTDASGVVASLPSL